ncbi:MAG: flavodoxin [Spirochaetes bacterium]|nr:flavodoxin [Spirochaetota bacterium]
MKTLIVYYSFEGNCAFIAEKIKAAISERNFSSQKTTWGEIPETTLLRLIPEGDEKKRTKVGGFFWATQQMFFAKKPRLKPFSVDISDYDLIILGTPVWAWSYAPAMASFLTAAKITGKKIALFCCHGGGKGKTMQKLKSALAGNNFAGEIDFKEPLKQPAGVKERLDIWLKGVLA